MSETPWHRDRSDRRRSTLARDRERFAAGCASRSHSTRGSKPSRRPVCSRSRHPPSSSLPSERAHASGSERSLRIWIDTDIGSDVDDALALAYALRHPELELVGVSTVFGDVALRSQIAQALLAVAGAPSIPVFTGLGAPLAPERVGRMFGHEGLGLLPDPHPVLETRSEPARARRSRPPRRRRLAGAHARRARRRMARWSGSPGPSTTMRFGADCSTSGSGARIVRRRADTCRSSGTAGAGGRTGTTRVRSSIRP
ncbi:MAG: nucleoside hydrolase [Myxococcota bacterium]